MNEIEIKNVLKIIYALIAIALVYVLYLIALGNRYEIEQKTIYDKWKQKGLMYYPDKAYEWTRWSEVPEKLR